MNKDILKQIGLTDYEVDIYLSLLAHGQISAYELAEKAGLYRQVTYDSLKRLQEKGFVSSVTEGKTKLFKAIDPKLILEFLNEQRDSYEQMLPKLIELDQAAKQPMIVETYKGKNVLAIALRDVINHLKKNDGENLCTAVDEHIALEKHKTACEQYERNMLSKGYKERIIIKRGTKGVFKRGTSTYRTINPKFFNPNPTQIYGDNISILIWGNPDYLIIIRNKGVADSYRKQFELMWQIAAK